MCIGIYLKSYGVRLLAELENVVYANFYVQVFIGKLRVVFSFLQIVTENCHHLKKHVCFNGYPKRYNVSIHWCTAVSRVLNQMGASKQLKECKEYFLYERMQAVNADTR